MQPRTVAVSAFAGACVNIFLAEFCSQPSQYLTLNLFTTGHRKVNERWLERVRVSQFMLQELEQFRTTFAGSVANFYRALCAVFFWGIAKLMIKADRFIASS